MDIKLHLQNIINELNSDDINKQRKRYLTSYIGDLEQYTTNHPDATQVPSYLELFCDLNPDAPECRKFDL